MTHATVEVVTDIRHSVMIDDTRNDNLTDQARELLAKFYLRPGENPQDGFARASVAWATYRGVTDWALAQRLYDYSSRGWFGYASPVLSNAPLPGEKAKGLPISCFAGYVPDSLEGLIDHTNEFRWLSVMGGGVGGHWSDVRSVSNKAPGPIPFIKTMDADVTAYRQGETRKGSYAAYLDVSHPDIVEFLGLRVPTGDQNRKCLSTGFHHAVNVTDAFMRAVAADAPWDLIDPHDKKVRETVKARELWEQILETRARTGEPYICFIDTANAALPVQLKRRGLKINGSNLCSEIMLPTGWDAALKAFRTFVCCLSSINLEKWDEYAEGLTQFVLDLVTMLDNVLEHFIQNAPDAIKAARISAQRERSIGLGTMGLHAFVQSRGLPFDSEAAVVLDGVVHERIKTAAVEASKHLARERGEAPDMEGTGLRFAHLMAIAPTANNASIVGTSPSVEPWRANAYTHRTRVGSHLIKNRALEKALDAIGLNTDAIWQRIILEKGSVQGIDEIPDAIKDVFKTAPEMDQMWIVKHAAVRQRHLCQGQSINLFFPAGATREYVNKVHVAAWKMGLKALYYYRTEARNRADAVSKKIERVALRDANAAADTSCVACEG
jgi:ribonucleoside-diphosphate reductase alpha chain